MPDNSEPSWKGGSYYETIAAAVEDFIEHGYDSADRLAFWLEHIGEAATRKAGTSKSAVSALRRQFEKIGAEQMSPGMIRKNHIGVGKFSRDALKPEMKELLSKRLDAAQALIRLNKEEAVSTTKRRFAGWASSIPEGGVPVEGQKEAKKNIVKSLGQLTYEERRVATDQGRKFAEAVNDLIGQQNGAIAVLWHHVHRENYNGRPVHIERDGKYFVLKDSWAYKEGLVTDMDGDFSEIDAPGTAVFCRCTGERVYNLRDLPVNFLTEKGKAYLAKADAARMARK